MAENQTPAAAGNAVIHFVASDPKVAPRGLGSGALYATKDFRACALVLLPIGRAEVRLLLNADGAAELARQLAAVAERLLGGSDHG